MEDPNYRSPEPEHGPVSCPQCPGGRFKTKCDRCRYRCLCNKQFTKPNPFKKHLQRKHKRARTEFQAATETQHTQARPSPECSASLQPPPSLEAQGDRPELRQEILAQYDSPFVEHKPAFCSFCLPDKRCTACHNTCSCGKRFLNRSTYRDHLRTNGKVELNKEAEPSVMATYPVLEAMHSILPTFVGHLPEQMFCDDLLTLDGECMDDMEVLEKVLISNEEEEEEEEVSVSSSGESQTTTEGYLSLLLQTDDPLPPFHQAIAYNEGIGGVADNREPFAELPVDADFSVLLEPDASYNNVGSVEHELERQEEQQDHAALNSFLASTLPSSSVAPAELPSRPECVGQECQKKVHCKKKECTCKACVCKKNKEQCDTGCRCTDDTCTNRTKATNNPFCQWTKVTDFDAATESRFKVPSFNDSTCGPTDAVPRFNSPVDAFFYFIPLQKFEEMARTTTEYARNGENWHDPTNIRQQGRTRERQLKKEHRNGFLPHQIKAYIAIILLMGMVRLPEQQDYWSNDSRFGNSWIKSTMGKSQWKEIHRFFWSDIWQLQNELNYHFRVAWRPYQFLAVDEGMIPFKGHFTGRQHVPTKPHSTGIKYFGIADSRGYLWSFWIYRGKAFHEEMYNQGTRIFNSAQPSNVITDFMTVLLQLYQACYVVICDSFFGSLHLAIELLKLGCRFIPTKSNRPSLLWTDLLHKGQKKGQTVALVHPSDGPLSFYGMSFWDRKKINFFTNCSMPNVVSHASHSRPALIHLYNQYMNSVDRADQQHTLYLFSHRRRKYTRAVFYSLIKLAIHNGILVGSTNKRKNKSERLYFATHRTPCQGAART